MKKQSRIRGIILSYLSTIFRVLSKLLLTPIYLRVLGYDDYGFYQYIFSIASYTTILDLGISSVINTFSISYKEKGEIEEVENVLFYAFMFTLCSIIIIVVIGFLLTVNATFVFGNSIIGKVTLTRQLLIVIIGELTLLLLEHFFEGVILSNEKYVTLRGVTLLQIVLRSVIIIVLLYRNYGVMAIALGDFLGVLCCLVIEFFYCKKALKLKIKFHHKDILLLKNIAILSSSLCLQSVVTFLNSSIDRYVLGRFLSTAAVSIYAVALTFSSFFEEIPTVIQRLYLPQTVKLISNGVSGEEMTDYVTKPGRYQFMLCAGMIGGFLLFGKQFISLWAGDKALDAWAIALFLMIPSIIPLIENVCLSILTAMNKRMFRSIVLCGIALLNLPLTIFLVNRIGLIGAPIGTCISCILGNTIAMNWYYYKKIKINVFRLLYNLQKGIFPVAFISTLLGLPLLLIHKTGWVWFICECFIFLLIYSILLYIFGMNPDEKKFVKGKLHLFVKNKIT